MSVSPTSDRTDLATSPTQLDLARDQPLIILAQGHSLRELPEIRLNDFQVRSILRVIVKEDIHASQNLAAKQTTFEIGDLSLTVPHGERRGEIRDLLILDDCTIKLDLAL